MSFKGNCSFCCSDVNNENAELITDTLKEIVDVLLINLDLGDKRHHAICNICSERLLAAFEFKSTCKYTDATIIPYVDCGKPTQLDLWEIYLWEKDNKQTVTLWADEKVCRLCMELTGKMFVPLQDIDKDLFQKLLPEINVNIIKDPVVCKTCFDSFATHSNFLKKFKNCVEQQEAIQNFGYPRKLSHIDELLPIKMEEVDIKLEDKHSIDSCMQSDQIQPEIEECEEIFIKSEDIKTDFEYDQTSIESFASDIRPAAFESKQQTKQTETGKVSQVQMYKCDRCNYETKIKSNLKSHLMIHKDPSEIQMHQCNFCDYKAKFKDRLKQHLLLVHRDPSEVRMFKCDICSYESKYKQKLKYHQLAHKDPSEIQMFRCDICDYETRCERYLKEHQLIHKDPSQAQMYKCDRCDYETKIKKYLRRHQVKHEKPSEDQMHKCEFCDYEARFKERLKQHQMVHKDPSQVQMHRCDVCSYETKYKGVLKHHQLKHKDPSQVQMFKCGICDYETKLKKVLKSHLLKHKGPSEVQMFKCAKCSYESRSKSNLSRHYFRRHKNPC